MTDTSDTAPPNMERRLSLRILTYWRGLRDQRADPGLSDVDPESISDMWPCCLVLKVEGCESDPIIATCGHELQEHGGEDLTGKPLSADPPQSLVANGASFFQQVLSKRVPITYGDKYTNAEGNEVLFRSAILPLGENDEAITHLLCAANCREVEPE